MTTLILSPYPEKIAHLVGPHQTVAGPPDQWPRRDFNQIISFGYRHIIREPYLRWYKDRLFNLHISLLPWNRGADPNFWSWFERTPKGVTLHHIDAGIDTGDIVAQRVVKFEPDDTLGTARERLHAAAVSLFAETWPLILAGRAERRAQPSGGNIHYVRDFAALARQYPIPMGPDVPTRVIAEAGTMYRRSLAPLEAAHHGGVLR